MNHIKTNTNNMIKLVNRLKRLSQHMEKQANYTEADLINIAANSIHALVLERHILKDKNQKVKEELHKLISIITSDTDNSEE